jgi:hypothetical protein
MTDRRDKLPKLPQLMSYVIALLASVIVYQDLQSAGQSELPALPPLDAWLGMPEYVPAVTDTDDQPDIRTFVIFDQHELAGGQLELTIGREFVDLDEWHSGVPSSEWCYIPLAGPGVLDLHLQLRSAQQGGVWDNEISNEELGASGITRAQLREARGKCVFIQQALEQPMDEPVPPAPARSAGPQWQANVYTSP